jgi:hypothetical protein
MTAMADFDPARAADELTWLKKNPWFDERPASIEEFLGPDYLNIEKKVRPGLRDALIHIFGKEVDGKRIARVERAMLTGAIGIGKTTFASIALPYMAHWVLCLKDPQDFFELLPGSRIAFMQMSTSESQAKEVVFGDIFARIKHSKWFVENYPHDPKFTNQIRFPKDIWVLPGDSAETTFEGYNILAGILDEMDSHKITKDKDYAEQGYDTIHSRISSRFIDEDSGGHKGLLICIGQMKKSSGFAAKKYEELLQDPKAYVVRQAIWESLGWKRFTRPDGTRDSFFYDTRRKQIIPSGVAGVISNPNVMEIPTAYRKNFENAPEKALRDLAGIPPATNDPFISLADKVDACVAKWKERTGTDESPVDDNPTRPAFREWFRAENDPRKRALHLDIAYSAEGDAAGIAMGYVDQVVEIDGEKKPYIVYDCIIRIKAAPGTEIMISDLRRYIYDLRYELGFKIKDVTMDGFQSTDTMQQLRKKKFTVTPLSVDKSTLPYEDLREAIYEERIEFPPYITYLNKGDTKRVEIAVQELLQLQHDGKKVDHPVGGSKDVADAMAGVCSTLMGDRQYRKNVSSLAAARARRDMLATGTDGALEYQPDQTDRPGMDSLMMPGLGSIGLKAPLPPSAGGLGLTIPQRLRPKE